MNNKNGFTLLEVLSVVVIIGILSALGFASMNELIQTNRAKEASRTLISFVERAVAEGKMRKETVIISVSANSMQVHQKNGSSLGPLLFSQDLPNGYSVNTTASKPAQCVGFFAQNSVEAKNRIGISGVDEAGCFVVCKGNYCGSAVKTAEKNTFTAYVKRNNNWEAL